MNLTVEKALALLSEVEKENPGRWVEHSKRVGEAAARIALELKLDVDKARALGYIHDIGKKFGRKAVHSVEGYLYIKSLGYDIEYANICLSHSYLNQDINCLAGGYPSKEEKGYTLRTQFLKNHTYTLYEKIINLCDLFCTDHFMTIEKRLIDLYLRLGVYENTVYHIQQVYALKEEIENKMGKSIYTLFPEIVENLLSMENDLTFGKEG